VGGRVDVTTASLLIDPLLTGVGTSLTVSGTTVQPLFSFPSAAITEIKLNAGFYQEENDTRDAQSRVVGAELVTGFPELGSGIAVGEGGPYSDGVVVLTTDGTASLVSDGGNFVDVSALAASKSGSSFTFQGTSAGHSVLWCSTREDSAGVTLLHWGVEIEQIVASAATPYLLQIQTAANVWATIDVMAVSQAEQYRYANEIFLRGGSFETLRAGLTPAGALSWAETTINGTTGHWMRFVADSLMSVVPTFERLRLIPSHTATNARGQLGARGLAQWRSELFGVGNVWGEVTGGGAKDGDITVGSGGVPTEWNQKIKKGKLDSVGDSISFQFALPDAICTAFPLEFRLSYSLDGGSPLTVAGEAILSVLVLGAGGVLIADSAGGITPRRFSRSEPRRRSPRLRLLARSPIDRRLFFLSPIRSLIFTRVTRW